MLYIMFKHPKPTSSAIYSQDAERNIIGLIVTDTDTTLTILADNITGKDFFSPTIRHVYETAQAMFAKGKPIDAFLLSEELKKYNPTQYAESLTTLLTIGGEVVSRYMLPSYIEILKEHSYRRQVQDLCLKLQTLVENPAKELFEIQEKLEELVATGFTESDRSHIQVQAAVKVMLQEMQERSVNVDAKFSIPTGFKTLDRHIFGLKPGEILCIGSEPGIGKTSKGLNIAANMARAGYRVGICSTEMNLRSMIQRLVASEASVDYKTFERPTPEDVIVAQDAKRLVESWGMVFDFNQHTTQSLVASMTKMKKQDKVDVILIDYVQHIDDPQGRTKTEKVCNTSLAIDRAAASLSVAVIALVQLNAPENNGAPERKNIQHSSQMGQDADFVLLLKRGEEKPACRGIYECEGWLRKNRNGESDKKIRLDFVGPHFRFEEA